MLKSFNERRVIKTREGQFEAELRDVRNFPRDVRDEEFDKLLEELTNLPDKTFNDQRTLAPLKTLQELKANPGEKYTIEQMMNVLNNPIDDETNIGLDVSDELVRRTLNFLASNEPGVIKEENEEGGHSIVKFYFDENAQNSKREPDNKFLEINIVEILDNNMGKKMKASEIADILMSDYGFPAVSAKTLKRSLDTLCLFDTRHHMVDIGRTRYYLATEGIPMDYLNIENADEHLDV